jgi:hypothetical protein
LLYLVSDAFETHFRVPLIQPDGEPLLGMDHFVTKNSVMSGTATSIAQWLSQHGADWVQSPNDNPKGSKDAATAKHHGDFSTDEAVLLATIARVAGVPNVPVAQPTATQPSPPSLIPSIAKTDVNRLRRSLAGT